MADVAGHGQLMNAIYRNQRFIYDATRKYFLLGRDELIGQLDVPENGTVLEVACGTGRNLAKIGARYRSARLFGFDISSEMLETAASNVARGGVRGRTALAQGDATQFDPEAMFGVAAFDRIVISYSLSMIPDWESALREAARHLAPGGSLHVVDFGDQAGLPGWFQRGLVAWLAKFHVTRRLTLEEALIETADAVGGVPDLRPQVTA